MPTWNYGAATELTGPVSVTDTFINVKSIADFPTETPFYVLVDHEIMQVTGIEGIDVSVVRAAMPHFTGYGSIGRHIEEKKAAAHEVGTAVTLAFPEGQPPPAPKERTREGESHKSEVHKTESRKPEGHKAESRKPS